ncbi:unnamed protein product [Rhodiola kirilowii]
MPLLPNIYVPTMDPKLGFRICIVLKSALKSLQSLDLNSMHM